MAQFTFGPVEFYLVGLEGDRPSSGVLDALGELIEAGTVRLLDFVVISKSEDGEVTAVEIEDQAEEYGLGGVELGAIGLAGEEDIAEFASLVPAGRAAALVVLELAWAKRLAEKLAGSGGEVLAVERIPAPVVNGLVDSLIEE
ncbi:MAG: hypothetical protein HZY75_12510 [Nocardioidaceae bacterium]|nr:MAG: hypothetical protein HZY75_12510 [Nocardioidaceae bacterium]